jgi:O-antigen repeat unit transporter
MSTSRKFSKGLGWGVIDNFSGTGINFIVGILLARALSPEAYSVIGLSLILVTISNIIADGGISTALIRKSKVSPADYNTGFFLNTLTAVIVYGILFLCAPPFAQSLELPILTDTVRWLGLIVIIAAFSIVPKAQLTKALNFKTQALASLSSSLIAATIAVLMLYKGYGIWSFIVQQIVRQSLYTLTLWSFIRQVPRWQFVSSSARELSSFGSRILLSGLIDAVYNNLYYFIIGKVFKPHTLGLYSRSEHFSSILSINFAMVLQRVSLPVLTQYKHDEQQFTQFIRTLLSKSSLLFSILFAIIAGTADQLILVIIGPQWIEAAPILRLLCISALFQPLIVVHQNVLQVYGEAKLFLRIEVAKKLMAVCIVAITLFTGFTALIWGIVAIAVLSFFINAYFGNRHLHNYSWQQQVKDIFPYHTTALIIGICLYAIGRTTLPLLEIILLQCGVAVVLLAIIFTQFLKADFHFLQQKFKSLT